MLMFLRYMQSVLTGIDSIFWGTAQTHIRNSELDKLIFLFFSGAAPADKNLLHFPGLSM